MTYGRNLSSGEGKVGGKETDVTVFVEGKILIPDDVYEGTLH